MRRALVLLVSVLAAGCARGGQQAPVAADPIRVEKEPPATHDSVGAVPESGQGGAELDDAGEEFEEGDELGDEDSAPAGDDTGDAGDDEAGGDLDADMGGDGEGDIEIDVESE